MGIVQRNSITITILSYLGILIGYVNKILLLTNFLTEEQVGLVNILTGLAVLYAQFSALGINFSVVKFFPFFRTPDRRDNGFFFWSALGVGAGFVVFTVLFLAFREPVMAYYSKESPLLSEHYLMLIPLGLATLSYNFFSSWLQAFYKTVVTSFVNEILLRLLISIEISLYALRLITFEQFVVGYVLIYFVPAAILLVYMATIRQTRFRPVPVTPRVRRLLSITAVYGLWQYLGGASMYIVPIIDQTMLAGICGLAEGGIYTTIIYMTSAMQMPYRSIVKVSTPVVTNLWKERDMEGMRKISRDASLMNLIAGCFLFVVIWVNLDNIFSLMPESYASGRYVFLFLGLGWVVNMYVGLNSTILMTSKKYRYEFMLSILLVGLTVLTNALMIPRWGMNGAALATMISLLVFNVGHVAFVWKFYRIFSLSWRDVLVALWGAAMIGVSMLIPRQDNFIVDGTIRTTLISLVFGTGIYYSKISPALNRMLEGLLRRIFVRRS